MFHYNSIIACSTNTLIIKRKVNIGKEFEKKKLSIFAFPIILYVFGPLKPLDWIILGPLIIVSFVSFRTLKLSKLENFKTMRFIQVAEFQGP